VSGVYLCQIFIPIFFCFQTHPVFKNFETRKILFGYSDNNGKRISITLELCFNSEASCEQAYNSVLESFKNLFDTTDLGNNDFLYWRKNDFSHFKYLYFIYTKHKALHSRIANEIELL
jgi:hypothetical protein